MDIREFKHDDDNEYFWAKMGAFFASPKVRESVGGFMTSGPAFTWWLALDNDKTAGFCAAKLEKGKAQVYLTYAYTVPAYRNTGVYTALFETRMKAVTQWPGIKRIYSICNDNSIGMLRARGFHEVGRRGQFTIVEMLEGEWN